VVRFISVSVRDERGDEVARIEVDLAIRERDGGGPVAFDYGILYLTTYLVPSVVLVFSPLALVLLISQKAGRNSERFKGNISTRHN